MKTLLQITAMVLAVSILTGGRSAAQVTALDDPNVRVKPTVKGTLSEGSTLAGGSEGGTLGQSMGLSGQGAAAKIESSQFSREIRRGGDFVGTDSSERHGFVGSQDASGSGPVRSATSGLKIQKTREANVQRRAATEQRNVMYDPRLVVAFEVNRQPPREVQAVLRQRLMESPNLKWAGPLEVTVRGDTAVLSGKAASSRDRELAALVLMFEPGIEKVDNRLTVADEDR